MRRFFNLLGRADVDRGWNDVVARLTHVDVIVRVNRLAGADRLSRRAGRQRLEMTSFAFVFVLVPEPVWKMSSGKCSSSLPFDDFLGRLHDERAPLASSKPRS